MGQHHGRIRGNPVNPWLIALLLAQPGGPLDRTFICAREAGLWEIQLHIERLRHDLEMDRAIHLIGRLDSLLTEREAELEELRRWRVRSAP
jgi:hypothetical protein